jgi:tRNA pseudouridine38-40 synthase
LDASNKPARRWRLDLAYDGKGFHGWAVQDGLRTVQGTLEEWISTVLRTAEPVQLTVAGRTDAGVHARGQVAHLDLARQYDAAHLAERLLRVLPDDVVVRRVSRAPVGFDARFSGSAALVYAEGAVRARPCARSCGAGWRASTSRRLNQRRNAVGLRDFRAFCRANDFGTSFRHLTISR